MKNKGCIYIATGEIYTKMSLASAKSLKKHNPNLEVHLFTDQHDINSPHIDGLTLISNPHYRSKVDYIHQSPFDQTLYLDADTFVLTDLMDLFELLDRFDIALTHNRFRNLPICLQTWKNPVPKPFPQFNSGVILFQKSPTVIDFLKGWQSAFHQAGFKLDQVTLRELLWQSSLRPYVLPPEYNVRSRKYPRIWDSTEAEPKILHYDEFKDFIKSASQR